jgi:membrane glycosyltransferase
LVYYGVLCSLFYPIRTVPRVEASKLLRPSSIITIWTSWLHSTSIWLYIQAMVLYYPPSLLRLVVENIGVFWSILLCSEETVLSVLVEAAKLFELSSAFTIQTS